MTFSPSTAAGIDGDGADTTSALLQESSFIQYVRAMPL
jgi:hypothetical protein